MKVFFDNLMVADTGSYSPSAGKPALVVKSWRDHGFAFDVVKPSRVSFEDLCRAHDPAYVRGVLQCSISNGFGTNSADVVESLRYTNGAMMDAARDAAVYGGFACAPVSGFHHAGHNFGGGYCTFNGLMVAAMDLLESGAAKKVGILDCDEHYGNGTDDIIDVLDVGYSVSHFTTGNKGYGASDAEWFVDNLPALVSSLFSDCDVLLYQAGADAHVNDPLGGWMTTDQLFRRDAAVFSSAKALGLPVAWVLAGGYQREPDGSIPRVLEIHDNTMRACLAA